MSLRVNSENAKNDDDVIMLTVDEVARRLSISVRGVWRQVSIGNIPEPVYVGRLARWPLKTIKDWMEEGCPAVDDFGK